MLPVEIVPIQETVVLRARGSELLILPHHVKHLKTCEKPKDFSAYFVTEALVNRPARKLFEAWLRKDTSLWPRLYKCIHKEMEIKEDDGDAEETPSAPKAEAKSKPAVKKEPKAEVKAAKAKDDEKPAKEKKEAKAAKADAKEEPKAKAKTKDEEKPAKKAKAKDEEEKPAKKATKKVAKAKTDEEKPAAKKKTKTAAAGSAKKKKG